VLSASLCVQSSQLKVNQVGSFAGKIKYKSCVESYKLSHLVAQDVVAHLVVRKLVFCVILLNDKVRCVMSDWMDECVIDWHAQDSVSGCI